MFSDKWNNRFMELAFLVASWSKDPSTKTGAVIVGPDKEIRATGYNGPVRGVQTASSRTPEGIRHGNPGTCARTLRGQRVRNGGSCRA